jgi:hypothetical protein
MLWSNTSPQERRGRTWARAGSVRRVIIRDARPDEYALVGVIECAQRREVRRLRLCTQPAMRSAQHLYETTGFTRTPDLDFEPVPGVTLRAYELALPLAEARSR